MAVNNRKKTDVTSTGPAAADSSPAGQAKKLLTGAASHGVYVDETIYEDKISYCTNVETYCSHLFELVFRREDALVSTVNGNGTNPKTGAKYHKLDENRMAAIHCQADMKFKDNLQ